MSGRAATVKQADLTRYIAGTIKAGVVVGKIKVSPDGTVTIIPAGMPGEDGPNPCDRLLD
ncbi:hypothetical protein NHN26_16415 [Rhodovulum tesquicola]|uniref:hypothetical protein n=1 Tax=Rhodovulum tesquicola TaxID=540254 RepID=UPI0020969DF2|nr:hypothetical protein [Rhodovulum tesquicola]MCO8146793.1 hypothetical protein [Rhodovulum tesquicola]